MPQSGLSDLILDKAESTAVVTSGSYERGFFFKGRRYHHIIEPHTGRPADSGLLSVTLIGDTAMELDALATGICVLGEERGLQGKFFLKCK